MRNYCFLIFESKYLHSIVVYYLAIILFLEMETCQLLANLSQRDSSATRGDDESYGWSFTLWSGPGQVFVFPANLRRE